MKIKKTHAKIVLTLMLLANISSPSFADGNAFTPLNFDDTAPVAAPATSTKAPKIAPVAKAGDVNILEAASGEIPTGNGNIQNAILELDNAQVGIRNDLLNYRAKYSDVDAQYKLIKNERTMLEKQVKSIEKRIKNIDRAKDKIRKNMV